MRLGFDVDGVLADFNTAFIRRVRDVTGRDLFGPGYVPSTWHYPQAVGYTASEVSKVWDSIDVDPTFWLALTPYIGAMATLERIRQLSFEHDVYFITSRPGIKAKAQTEVWLATHSGDFMWNPTVLISSDKRACAEALQLQAYVDDRLENCIGVSLNFDPGTETFLLSRPWNFEYSGVILNRVETVDDMLDRYEALREARVAA